jgi:hypothetical protein
MSKRESFQHKLIAIVARIGNTHAYRMMLACIVTIARFPLLPSDAEKANNCPPYFAVAFLTRFAFATGGTTGACAVLLSFNSAINSAIGNALLNKYP